MGVACSVDWHRENEASYKMPVMQMNTRSYASFLNNLMRIVQQSNKPFVLWEGEKEEATMDMQEGGIDGG